MTSFHISEYLPKNIDCEYHFFNPKDETDFYTVFYSINKNILECNLYSYGLLSVSQKVEFYESSAEIVSTKFHHPDDTVFESLERSILIPTGNFHTEFKLEVLEDDSLMVDKFDPNGNLKRREIYRKGMWLSEITSYTNPAYDGFTMRLKDSALWHSEIRLV